MKIWEATQPVHLRSAQPQAIHFLSLRSSTSNVQMGLIRALGPDLVETGTLLHIWCEPESHTWSGHPCSLVTHDPPWSHRVTSGQAWSQGHHHFSPESVIKNPKQIEHVSTEGDIIYDRTMFRGSEYLVWLVIAQLIVQFGSVF